MTQGVEPLIPLPRADHDVPFHEAIALAAAVPAIDAGDLSQLAGELLDNACKFSLAPTQIALATP